jgi:hypothetical protein
MWRLSKKLQYGATCHAELVSASNKINGETLELIRSDKE